MKSALCAVMLLGATMMTGLFAPPAGRPPMGPLERYEPKLYDLKFCVGLGTLQQRDGSMRQGYDLSDSPIVMPVIFQDTWSKVHSDSLTPQIWLGAKEDTGIRNRFELQEGLPMNEHLAVMTIDRFEGQTFRWQLTYRVQVWSSRVNDEKAAAIAWPREWPEEVKDALRPQKYIESDDPLFAKAVEDASQGKLRLVPPYLAAKDLVRYCLKNIRVSGDGQAYEGEDVLLPGGKPITGGTLRGMELIGAQEAAKRGYGTPHDLVCVCIATLRAAGIPARPVIGTAEDGEGRSRFVTWGEFYLPDAGWIPFDPDELRGKAFRQFDVRKPWPEFGTMKDLNERIPLSFHFIPPASVQSPQYPAVWGWDPRPLGDPSSKQQILIEITSRGAGVEDPQ